MAERGGRDTMQDDVIECPDGDGDGDIAHAVDLTDAVGCPRCQSSDYIDAPRLEDGYNTTVVLDCGCQFRLNIQGNMPRPKVGWYYSCIDGHSAIREYDRTFGTAEFDRDHKAVEVRDEVWGAT